MNKRGNKVLINMIVRKILMKKNQHTQNLHLCLSLYLYHLEKTDVELLDQKATEENGCVTERVIAEVDPNGIVTNLEIAEKEEEDLIAEIRNVKEGVKEDRFGNVIDMVIVEEGEEKIVTEKAIVKLDLEEKREEEDKIKMRAKIIEEEQGEEGGVKAKMVENKINLKGEEIKEIKEGDYVKTLKM